MASANRSLDSHNSQGKRIVAAAAERNKDAILEVLKTHFPSTLATPPSDATATTFLEIACGTGQHAAYFSQALPHLRWQPTEATMECFESISAWAEDIPNMLPPIILDASTPPETWPIPQDSCVGILCANMTHISPWESTKGLLAGAGRVLVTSGRLFLYGPFMVDGKPTTESNGEFDRTLKYRNSQWGLRDVADVDACAVKAGLQRREMLPMPANNFTLIYEKTDS